MKLRKRIAVFDVETNGLLEEVTKLWVLAIEDYNTGDSWFFTDYDDFGQGKSGNFVEGVKFLLKEFDLYVCHNIMGYDWWVLNKFFPNLWNLTSAPFKKCWDTLVQSKVQWFDRPYRKGIKGNHGLAYYGNLLGYPKPVVEDWSAWDKGKLHRVLKDVDINVRTLKHLNKEAKTIGLDFKPAIVRASRTQWCETRQELNGWLADKDALRSSVKELDIRLKELSSEIEPKMPFYMDVASTKCTWEEIRDKWEDFFRKVPKTRYYKKESQKKENKGEIVDFPYKPTYMPTIKILNKDGSYDAHVAKWFGLKPEEGKDNDRMVMGPYVRVQYKRPKMSQHEKVKQYLSKYCGWEPTEWNYKEDSTGRKEKHKKDFIVNVVKVKDGKRKVIKECHGKAGEYIKTSPVLTEDSYPSIKGGVGEQIALWNTLSQRRRTLENPKKDDKGWLNQLRPDGKLSAGAMVFNTSTGRMVQTKLVNVPSGNAVYGKPMRKPWVASKGFKLSSVDMDSAQLRLLADYLGDPLFTHAVVNGTEYEEVNGQSIYRGTDAHTINAIAFGRLEEDMVKEARETQDHDLIDKITGIRKVCKNGIYAYLFGAGDLKFARTIGLFTAAEGKAIKDNYRQNIQGLDALYNKLQSQWKENKWKRGGYIQVLGDTWLWCNSEHKLLNYLLMGSEAQLQNEAICWMNHQVEKQGLVSDIKQLGAFHDENTWESRIETLDICKGLMDNMYGVASDRLGLDVRVTGTAALGDNWLDIH